MQLLRKKNQRYFADKEWQLKDQRKSRELRKQWKRDYAGTKAKLLKGAERALTTPFAADGNVFYGHKEASCMAYVNSKGQHLADLTGQEIEGSSPFMERHLSPLKRQAYDKAMSDRRTKLPLRSDDIGPKLENAGRHAAMRTRRFLLLGFLLGGDFRFTLTLTDSY